MVTSRLLQETLSVRGSGCSVSCPGLGYPLFSLVTDGSGLSSFTPALNYPGEKRSFSRLFSGRTCASHLLTPHPLYSLLDFFHHLVSMKLLGCPRTWDNEDMFLLHLNQTNLVILVSRGAALFKNCYHQLYTFQMAESGLSFILGLLCRKQRQKGCQPWLRDGSLSRGYCLQVSGFFFLHKTWLYMKGEFGMSLNAHRWRSHRLAGCTRAFHLPQHSLLLESGYCVTEMSRASPSSLVRLSLALWQLCL